MAASGDYLSRVTKIRIYFNQLLIELEWVSGHIQRDTYLTWAKITIASKDYLLEINKVNDCLKDYLLRVKNIETLP